LDYGQGENVNIKTISQRRANSLKDAPCPLSDSDKVAGLDALAGSMDRNRTYLLSEAVRAYLETQHWHLQQIGAGITEADAGKVVAHDKVRTLAKKWRRQK
jgi:RHH-type transcriptional regulator, rel operon repressor / antitoxin RelB